MVSARSSCPVITRAKVVSIRDTIIISDGGGGIFVLMVVVKPVVRLKMPEGNPVLLSLKSWIMCYSLLNTILMIALKTNPKRFLTLHVSKLVSQSVLTFVVGFNVCLIGLIHDSLRVASVVGVETTHISPITKIDYIVRFNIVDQRS